MAASGLLVQELWDEIVDCLHDSRTDLLASALVCRAFVARAQMHLFRSIVIASHRHQTTVSGTQLLEILSSSPHLIDYIYDLYIGRCDPATLTPIVQIAWSRISTISLVHSDDEQAEPALELIWSLASLSTLQKIAFYSNGWTADHLRTVLTDCNPGVSNLAFHTCSPEISPSICDNPTEKLTPSPTITHLELFFADTIPDFLMDPACPLDLSHLHHVKFGWSTGTALHSFLYAHGHTIQSLDVDSADHSLDTLDLGSLPALAHIEVRGAGSSLQHFMERSRESNVHTICYRLGAWQGKAGLPNLQTLESSVLAANMPRLRRVEVKVIMDSYNKYTHAEWIPLIQDSMSQIAQTGFLAIKFVSL
ncbi:hypothetical protein K438DRAFT_1970754 [Mycena galopus ATCC 62051]|nr:hypothetical protein K438DRAFT_1970754 [Mycena galopus ATCC 62051]